MTGAIGMMDAYYDELIGNPNEERGQIDLAEANRFLEVMAQGERVTFQTFDDTPAKRQKLARTLHGTLDEHATLLGELNAKGAGVFVTVNATDGGGRKRENVTRVRALFADFDDPAPDTLERLRADDLPPSIIVESSHGKLHAYWPVDGLELSEFTSLQKRVATAWGSDPSVNDLPRVLRLPGLMHNKGEPQPVRLIETSGKRYGAEELRARYRTSTANESTTADDDDDLLALLPTRVDLAATFQSLADGVNVHENARDLVGRLLHDGMSESTLRALFTGVIAPAVGVARGDDRAAELTGSELDRMIEGAKVKGFAPIRVESAGVKWVDLSDLMTAEIPPPRFIFEPLFPRKEVTLFAADGGTGKSVLGLVLAAHVACGRDWAGLNTEPGRVLFLSLEDIADTCRLRLRAVARAYGLDDRVTQNIIIGDGTDGDGALLTNRDGRLYPTRVLSALTAMMQRQQFDLIVIDNGSNAFSGNENDRNEVVSFIGALRRLARGADAALLLLAHVDKASVRGDSKGSRYSGSTAWHNSARSRLAMSADAEGVLTLVQEKLNLARKLEREIRIAFVNDIPIPCDQIEGFAENAGLAAQRDEELILRLMNDAIDAGENIPAAQGGGHTARHLLMRLEGAPAEWAKKPGKDRFDAAMMRLKRKGLVTVEQYRNNQRQQKDRLVPTARQLADCLDDQPL